MKRAVKDALPKSKFVEIVQEIRKMIEKDGLLPGDKIPSERELSEHLDVGRSSVREALRALELLGLIETRRGEGTFLRHFHDHRLVELLGMFILQDPKIQDDVMKAKEIMEVGGLSLALQHRSLHEKIKMARESLEKEEWSEYDFFSFILDLGENHLLKKIWLIVSDYATSIQNQHWAIEKYKPYYLKLLDAMDKQDFFACYRVYQEIQKLSNGR
ncbi:FadR/GntR family transcriptional regulator [Bacillus smithii]|uniref:FadR/GntR family transcriptional regulator n=1 Tax=Bacillus smithii TaxID=1479 RepID=UPI0030C9AE9E